MTHFKTAGIVAALLVGFALPVAAEENPEYTYWAGHDVGTWVKLDMVTKAGGTETKMGATAKLVEKADDKVVVEMVMTMAGTAMPAQKREITAEIEGGEEGGEEAESNEVEETITLTVNGEETDFTCKVVTAESGGNTSKTWMCTEVPGGVVKMVAEGAGYSTEMVVVEWGSE